LLLLQQTILHTKFVTFVTVLAFLVAAIYSSSASVVFGAISCKASSNGVDQICVTSNKNGKITAVNYCYVDKDEKSVCIKVYSSATGPDIPADLRDAAGLRDAPGPSDSSDVAPEIFKMKQRFLKLVF
jgi:hypothetical protein